MSQPNSLNFPSNNNGPDLSFLKDLILCTSNEEGFLNTDVCNVASKLPFKDESAYKKCISTCKNSSCNFECYLSNKGLDYKKVFDNDYQKSKKECGKVVKTCMVKCNEQDMECKNKCLESEQEKLKSCMAKELNVSNDALMETITCQKDKCFRETDLSKFQSCHGNCISSLVKTSDSGAEGYKVSKSSLLTFVLGFMTIISSLY